MASTQTSTFAGENTSVDGTGARDGQTRAVAGKRIAAGEGLVAIEHRHVPAQTRVRHRAGRQLRRVQAAQVAAFAGKGIGRDRAG